MKNLILGFSISIMLILLLSTSLQNVMVVKPMKPTSVVSVESFKEAIPFIQRGYIIKTSSGEYHRIIILEKY